MYAIRSYYGYQNVNWNRNFTANLNYNRYKRSDWVTAEVNLGWSYYSNLRSRFNFGVKYVPGRITSYNVCYTKLLRAVNIDIFSPRSFISERRWVVTLRISLCTDMSVTFKLDYKIR